MSSNTDFFPLERNRYFYGKLLTVRDFEVEQQYVRRKQQLLSRLSTGAGVVCGLGVLASDDSTLLIESGMALDYQGRVIALEEPILRKLPMLEGYESLGEQDSAYLCLTYNETDMEPVNAVGGTTGESRQFNMTREGYRLFLTTQPPEYRGLLEAQGRENVSVLYTSQELTLVLSVPSAVCAGEEFQAEVLVIKNEKTPPVHFRLEGESPLADSGDGKIRLEFRESPEETRMVYAVNCPLKALSLHDTDGPLFSSGGELDVELGSHRFKKFVEVDAKCRLCRDRESLDRHIRSMDTLERHLRGRDMPIYLAKLELIHATNSVFLSSVTSLPFRQRPEISRSEEKGSSLQSVTAAVRSLEYWQKPDVRASYQPSGGELHFEFGIPSPEQYDYAVTHGTVDLILPSGLRVNSRVYSEEILHGLGPGSVDIRLSLEFPDENRDGEATVCFGNTEVFQGKKSPVTAPRAEVAALVYPQRGTMRIGLWLHDMVEGNRLTIHYFAQKPERDTSRLISKRAVGLTVSPEFSRVSRRGTLRLQAEVTGTEDKAVLWSIKEENGGDIDHNGVYQAPEEPGTFEIVATSRADEAVTASAFVIVE